MHYAKIKSRITIPVLSSKTLLDRTRQQFVTSKDWIFRNFETSLGVSKQFRSFETSLGVSKQFRSFEIV